MERRAYSSTLSVMYSHFYGKRTIWLYICSFVWTFYKLKTPQWKEVRFIPGVYWKHCGVCRGLRWYCSGFKREITAANHKYLRQWLRVYIRNMNPLYVLQMMNAYQSLFVARTVAYLHPGISMTQFTSTRLFGGVQIKFLIWRVPSPSSVVQPSHSAQCVHPGGFFTCLCDWQNPSNTVTRLPILKQCNVYMKIKYKAAPS